MAEAPAVAEVQQAFGDDVNFIGMAGRADNEDITAFISERDVGAFPHIVDIDGTIWSEFGVRGQPAFVFIDHSGSIALHMGRLGLEELTTVVEQLKIQ